MLYLIFSSSHNSKLKTSCSDPSWIRFLILVISDPVPKLKLLWIRIILITRAGFGLVLITGSVLIIHVSLDPDPHNIPIDLDPYPAKKKSALISIISKPWVWIYTYLDSFEDQESYPDTFQSQEQNWFVYPNHRDPHRCL